MAREITEQDLANKGVSGLPDVPGLTTEAMQKKFDEISKELLVPRFNEMAKEVNEVNENLTELNSDLEWKLLASVAGGVSVNLPNSFNELHIKVVESSTDVGYVFHLIPKDLEESTYFRSGHYSDANINSAVSLLATSTYIKLDGFLLNGANVINSSNVIVSYR